MTPVDDETQDADPKDDSLAAHTLPYRARGWSGLFFSVGAILLVVAGGVYGYQWLMGDLPAARETWTPIGLVVGLLLGPVISTVAGKRPGSAGNLALGCIAGALAGIAIAGALAKL